MRRDKPRGARPAGPPAPRLTPLARAILAAVTDAWAPRDDVVAAVAAATGISARSVEQGVRSLSSHGRVETRRVPGGDGQSFYGIRKRPGRSAGTTP